MSKLVAQQSAEDNGRDTNDPALGWIIAFLFVVSFLGLFSVVPLRKVITVILLKQKKKRKKKNIFRQINWLI